MKFGVREICDVVFKATAEGQKVGYKNFRKGQPCFKIDTATTSEMTQESTTVYAQGGKGYNRLIAWEGEKTMTFTVTDALMSPMGLAVLTGAGLIKGSNEHTTHVHCTYKVAIDKTGNGKIDFNDLCDELGLDPEKLAKICICNDIDVYGTVLDDSGAGIAWLPTENIFMDEATAPVAGDNESGIITVLPKVGCPVQIKGADGGDDEAVEIAMGKTVELDFYVLMNTGVTEITIEPGDFGGYFYVEADTLFRREDNGKDMAATLTFPRVKIQSGFTFTMAASGDPSTFDFVMDAMPGYTFFDRTKKVCVAMTIVGSDETIGEESNMHPNILPEKHGHDVEPHMIKVEDEDASNDIWVLPVEEEETETP